MAGSKPKGRKGKIGRKKGQMLAYANEQRHEKSHIKRILRHLARYGERTMAQKDHPRRKRPLVSKGDRVAEEALKRYRAAVGIYT
jgi:hypothetical protein